MNLKPGKKALSLLPFCKCLKYFSSQGEQSSTDGNEAGEYQRLILKEKRPRAASALSASRGTESLPGNLSPVCLPAWSPAAS